MYTNIHQLLSTAAKHAHSPQQTFHLPLYLDTTNADTYKDHSHTGSTDTLPSSRWVIQHSRYMVEIGLQSTPPWMHHVYWQLCTVWGLNCTSIHTVPACAYHVYTLCTYTVQQKLCQCLQAGVEKRELLKWGHNDMSRHFRKCLHSAKTLVQILLLFYAIYCVLARAWEIINNTMTFNATG